MFLNREYAPKNMKFYITSTINVEAESRQELVERLEWKDKKEQREILWDLWDNAEIDENLEEEEK